MTANSIELGLSRSDGWLQELTQDARYRRFHRPPLAPISSIAIG